MSETTKIYRCSGCGRPSFDPSTDLVAIRMGGHHSCCPDRRMEVAAELPTKLASQLVFVKHVPKPGKDPLADPWCWVWTGRTNRNGYGRTRWLGKEPVTHRLIFKLLKPEVKLTALDLLDHLCCNRPCGNPSHMDPVDNRTNTLRGEAVLFKRPEEYTT